MIFNLWIATPLTNLYLQMYFALWFLIVTKLQSRSSNEMILWVGVTTTCGTVLKGRSIRKVEDHCTKTFALYTGSRHYLPLLQGSHASYLPESLFSSPPSGLSTVIVVSLLWIIYSLFLNISTSHCCVPQQCNLHVLFVHLYILCILFACPSLTENDSPEGMGFYLKCSYTVL